MGAILDNGQLPQRILAPLEGLAHKEHYRGDQSEGDELEVKLAADAPPLVKAVEDLR